MDPIIISSLISGGVSLSICLFTQSAQVKKMMDLLEYKINELTKRVDKHNNLIERTYKLEEQTAVQDEQIKSTNKRISNLEKMAHET